MPYKFNQVIKEEINPNAFKRNRLDSVFDSRLKSPDHIRYELSFGNDTDLPILMEHSETKNEPLVGKANDYYMTILRARIPNNLPLFIFEKDAYKVGLYDSVANINYSTYLDYLPVNSNNPDDLGIYTIRQFLAMLNDSLDLLRDAFVNANAISPTDLDFAFLWENGQINCHYNYKTATFITDPLHEIGIPYTQPNQRLQLRFNSKLRNKINGFTYNFNTPSPPIANPDPDLNYRFVFSPQDIIDTTSKPGFRVVTVKQEYPSISAFATQGRVIVTSSRIPVGKVSISGKDNKEMPAVLDFLLNPTNDIAETDQPLFYVADQPRLLDLYSENPITTLDFGFYYEDLNKNLIPMIINPGQWVDLKVEFHHKSLYNNMYSN